MTLHLGFSTPCERSEESEQSQTGFLGHGICRWCAPVSDSSQLLPDIVPNRFATEFDKRERIHADDRICLTDVLQAVPMAICSRSQPMLGTRGHLAQVLERVRPLGIRPSIVRRTQAAS